MLPTEIVGTIADYIEENPNDTARTGMDAIASQLGIKKGWSTKLYTAVKRGNLRQIDVERIENRFNIGYRTGAAVKRAYGSIRADVSTVDELVKLCTATEA